MVAGRVPRIRILDRDFVEPSNRQRQILFDEADARAALPKRFAAEAPIRALNSDVQTGLTELCRILIPETRKELLSGDVPDNGVMARGQFENALLGHRFCRPIRHPWGYCRRGLPDMA